MDKTKEDTIEIEEKNLINVDSVMSKTLLDIKKIITPKIRTHFIFLDGRNRFGVNTSGAKNDTDNKLVWYLNYDKPVNYPGYININRAIKYVISIEMTSISFTDRKSVNDAGFETIAYPLLPLSAYAGIPFAIRNNNWCNWIANQKISILIEELSSQSFISPDNKCHFIAKRKEIINVAEAPSFDRVTRGFATFETYLFNKGKYKFHKPISMLDSVTLRLYDPVLPVVMDKEIYDVVISYDNGDAGDPNRYDVIITFSEQPYINYNDIEISGFTTSDPTTDKTTIDQINNRFAARVSYPQNGNFGITQVPFALYDPNAVYYTRVSDTVYNLNISGIGLTPLADITVVKAIVRNNFRAILRVECLDAE